MSIKKIIFFKKFFVLIEILNLKIPLILPITLNNAEV